LACYNEKCAERRGGENNKTTRLTYAYWLGRLGANLICSHRRESL
jgi:hypothetical protein